MPLNFCLHFLSASLHPALPALWKLDSLPNGFYPSRGAWERTARWVGAQLQVIHRLVQVVYCHSAASGIFFYIDVRLNIPISFSCGCRLFSFLFFCALSPLCTPLIGLYSFCVFVKAIVSAHHRGSQKVCHCSIGDWWVFLLSLHVLIF